VESFAPDIALLDITMPGMNGSELAQLLRLHDSCSLTKLVALTGPADVANNAGTDEWIRLIGISMGIRVGVASPGPSR
jgi:CheY-like chemotaxis protein